MVRAYSFQHRQPGYCYETQRLICLLGAQGKALYDFKFVSTFQCKLLSQLLALSN